MVFIEDEVRTVHHPHNDSLVITILVANKKMDRVLVDSGSSADIMTLDVFDGMGLNRGDMRCVETWLSGFAEGCIAPKGVIDLPVTLGEGKQQATKMTKFLVMDTRSAYNVILGRPSLYRFRAAVSVYHHVMKFPCKHGVGTLRGEQQAPRSCYEVSCHRKRDREGEVMMTATDQWSATEGRDKVHRGPRRRANYKRSACSKKPKEWLR